MSAELIPFPVRPGNGAREALIEILLEKNVGDHQATEILADVLITLLWYRGFKIVPVEGSE